MLRPPAVLLVGFLLAAAALRADSSGSESEQIARLLPLSRGQDVAVTGPAAMSLVPLLADRVGPDGHVYVVDSDGAIVQNLRRQIEQAHLANTIAIAGTPNDIALPHTVDLVVIHNSYHHIPNRSALFSRLRKYLRAGASIAVIDYYRRPMKVGPPWKERVSSSRAMREMKSFGFVLAARHRVSPYRYFLVYRTAQR